MNKQEAKHVLLRYRPGTDDDRDPEVSTALNLVSRDPGLAQWFENHCRFQQCIQAKLRAVNVPAGLKEQYDPNEKQRSASVAFREGWSRSVPLWH